MQINKATYLISSPNVEQCPPADRPEYAFIGRSNVGKSSLINMVTGRRKLARVSGNPGKTIAINHFLINDKWYLVDLPGYGYAKRSKTERTRWEKMIRGYLLKRKNLLTVFLLIDLRHSPQPNDMAFMAWLAESQVPFVILFTKSDKLGRLKKQASASAYARYLERDWESLPKMIVTSAVNGEGRDLLLDYIEETNLVFSGSG